MVAIIDKSMDIPDRPTSDEIRSFRQMKRFSQREMAEFLGVERGTYKNYEIEPENGGSKFPTKLIPALYMLGFKSSIKNLSIPAGEMDIAVPFIGLVSANTPPNWDFPNDTDSMEYVPAEMGHLKGRFAARIDDDCMAPLLWHDDIVVFQESSTPKVGRVVLFRTHDGYITVKQMKHDGTDYYLHPLNAKYSDSPAAGTVVGYLVGIVRYEGRRKKTDYDPDGIRP